MNLKKLILLLLLGVAGYWAYGYFTTNFSQEMIAYKRYANALLDNEPSRARTVIQGDQPSQAFANYSRRQERMPGEIDFVYYEVLSKVKVEETGTTTLTVRQKVYYDPEGVDTFKFALWKKQIWQDVHTVQMRMNQSAWKVINFSDFFTIEAAQQSTRL